MSTAPATARVIALDEERPGRTIWRLAWPAILENLLVTAVFFSDTLVVGWLRDEAALAGQMLAGVLLWVMSAPFEALGIAAASLVARAWGAGEHRQARFLGAQALALAFALAAGAVALLWVIGPGIIHWMGGAPEVVGLGGLYLRVALVGMPLGLPMLVANAVIRGSGDTRTPMVNRLLMNVLNVGLSVALAFGLGPLPALGLTGVACGTAAAQALGGGLAVGLLFSGRLAIRLAPSDLLRPRAHPMDRVWRLALPAMVDRLVGSGAHVLMLMIVALLGTAALAAHSVAINVESLAFMVCIGLYAATATLVGQAIGAGRLDLAARLARRTLLGAGLFTAGLGLVFLATAPWFVHVFGATPEVLRLAGLALQVSAIELPGLGATMVLTGCLNGAGDTRSPLWIHLACIPVFRLGAVWLFAITWGWGLAGVWLGTAAFWAGRALLLGWVFRRGAWQLIHAREMSALEAQPASSPEAA